MSGTYSQIIVHVVFAVKNRNPLIKENWEGELYKYMTGIIGAKGQKLLAINGTRDHVHLLLGLTTDCRLSDLIRELKKSSNKFIRERKFTGIPFYWQEGFGAFSIGKRHMGKVIEYIQNQKLHHGKRKFDEELVDFLVQHDIDFEEEYLF